MSLPEDNKQSRESSISSAGRSNPLPTHVAEKGELNVGKQSAEARFSVGNEQPRPRAL